MEPFSLQDKVSINTNIDSDTFVGISYDQGDVKISFPLGYHLSPDDAGKRKDIILLINTISKNSDLKKSKLPTEARKYEDEVSFPMQAYLYLIYNFAEQGYYKETEPRNVKSKRGKINWTKTIKAQKPLIQEDSAFYLDYIVKKNEINMNELITLIHEFCVYESFKKVGWIFSTHLPAKPHIKFQYKLFASVLKEKISITFNDTNKRLFQNMLAMINWLGDIHSPTRYSFGTYRFEYVWEKMIDRVYGVDNKSDYFPHTTWRIKDKDYPNASLEPDTIMLMDDKVYVLDAKYYRYGSTKRPGDLPESTSINKQITYAEYIAESGCFNIGGEAPKVYNVFVLPFDAEGDNFDADDTLLYIGSARSDWKVNDKAYEFVHGILLDVKHLMQCSTRHNFNEIEKMVKEIEKADMFIRGL